MGSISAESLPLNRVRYILQSGLDIIICLLFSGFSNVYHSACVWPTALKLGCITNFDILFLVMGFIYLVDEI